MIILKQFSAGLVAAMGNPAVNVVWPSELIVQPASNPSCTHKPGGVTHIMLLLPCVPRAHVDSAKEIAKLLGEKFDLLQPGSAAVTSKASSGSGPSQATIKCLEELKEIIGNHLKVRISQ